MSASGGIEFDENALPSDIPLRGRARSRSRHGDDDDDFVNEIESAAAAVDGREPPPPRRSHPTSSSSSSSSGRGGRGGLSRKTVETLTDLRRATALPPELSASSDSTLHEDQADLEERQLAEALKATSSASSAASTHAAAPAGAAAAASSGSAAAASGVAASTTAAPARGVSSAVPTRKHDDKEFDVQIKLLLLGDGGVGKTSLLMRYSEDKFSTSLLATAGVDYKTQLLDIDGKRVKCQIWDTAGQQRFHVITQAYYRGAHGIVLVYDASEASEVSFNSVRYWMDNIRQHADKRCIKILIGNKIDVKPKHIDSARGRALAEEFGMKFYETSAKDGTGVRESFHGVARDILAAMGAGVEAAGSVKKVGEKGKDKDKDCSIM